ncbi:MAG: AI-2E family transporter [Ruminococcaceae bacterium]|nr:AI-2E family transporter [Oscillospiraceae bacterium]
MEKKDTYWKKWAGAFFFGAALIVFYKTFDNLPNVFSTLTSFLALLTPFTIGILLAFFLYPATARLENRLSASSKGFFQKRKKGISILAVYFGFLALLAIAIGVILPRLSVSVADFFKKMPGFMTKLTVFVDGLVGEGGILENLQLDTFLESLNISTLLQNFFMQDIWGYIEGVKGVTSAVTSFILGIVICAYTLFERENLFRLVRFLFGIFMKPETLQAAGNYIHRISAIFYKFFFGMMIDSLVVGIVAMIGFSIMKIPYAAILGITLMVFNMIPYFGPFLGSIPAVLVALLSKGIYPAIWTVLFILVLQQLDGNLLAPRILGGSVGVSPFWVIFAIVVFGGLFGLWGMVFGVPILAAIQMLAKDYLDDGRLNFTDSVKQRKKGSDE